MLVRIGRAAYIQGVSASTMRRWEKEERILPCKRTRGGYRRYKLSQRLGEEKQKEENDTQHKQIVIGYARVSGAKQKKELITQQEHLRTFAKQQGESRKDRSRHFFCREVVAQTEERKSTTDQ